MLVAVGWWPPDIPFDTQDMVTVAKVIEESNKRRGRG
jgi:hypothetical protein